MNSFKNTKTHLDDLFAEARTQNVTPVEDLLKAGIPQNSFKNGFVKIGIAGVLAATAISAFFLKENEHAAKPENLLKATPELVRNESFTKEIPQEKPAPALVQTIGNRNPPAFKKTFATKPSVQGEEAKTESSPLQQTPESIRLSAIPLVELRDFELKKLGIEVLKDGDLQITQSPNGDTVHFVSNVTSKIMTKENEDELFKLALSPLRLVSWEEHHRLNPPAFSPKRVTDLSGTRSFLEVGEVSYPDDPVFLDLVNANFQQPDNSLKKRLREWANEEARKQDSIEKTRKYIPVRAGNFIVWYSPTEEVLERLPDFVANTIRAELSGKDVIIQTEEFREEYPTSGFCYLDLCEKTNGAITCSKVFPNPSVGGRTTVSYELSEPRGIITSLYDLSGRKLREFSPLKTQEKGKHEEEISLEGIEKGIYLVAIITDKGERLSRRLIID